MKTCRFNEKKCLRSNQNNLFQIKKLSFKSNYENLKRNQKF